MYYQGRFYPFDSILKAILFPDWLGNQQAPLGLVGLFLRLTNDWKSLEQHTVDSWMRKWQVIGLRADVGAVNDW